MKRRSRAGGNPTKGRARKAAKPTTRNPPKGTARSTSSSAGEKTEVGRLTRELNEALERQTATSEVLQSISRYPGDLQPVFQAMLKNAVRLCDAKFGNIYRWDGDALHLVATENAPGRLRTGTRALTASSRSGNPHRAHDCEQNGGSRHRYACGESLCRS